MAISKTHIRVYPLDAIQQFDLILCSSWYFLRITSNDSFVQKKIDGHVYSIQVQGWLRTFSGSYHTIQFMFSFDAIYLETLTIFGLFRIIQHISITFVKEFVIIQISCKTSWLLFQTVMWDIGYPNVLSDGVQNQLQVQSILKRGTFCQMGHWKSKEKFSLLLRFEEIESHDFSILNFVLVTFLIIQKAEECIIQVCKIFR